MDSKTCAVCREVKKLSSFRADKRTPDGRERVCVQCKVGTNVVERRRAVSMHEYELHPDRWYDRKLRKDYGISLVEYEKLLAEQGGQCAVCHGTKTRNGYRFAVDHDHVSGKVRGLLCDTCNRAIGLLKDDPAVLRAAASYLERNGDGESK